MNIPGYDAWKLSNPDDDHDEIGTEDGQQCNRYPEPDEDQPRGYKPKPCGGVMMFENDGETVSCATCGEIA